MSICSLRLCLQSRGCFMFSMHLSMVKNSPGSCDNKYHVTAKSIWLEFKRRVHTEYGVIKAI